MEENSFVNEAPDNSYPSRLKPLFELSRDRSGHKWPSPAQKKSRLLLANPPADFLAMNADGGEAILNQLEKVVGHGQHVGTLTKVKLQLLAHGWRDTRTDNLRAFLAGHGQ